MNEPHPWSIYTHVKTRAFYQVICCGQMEADGSYVVIYRACRVGDESPEQVGPVWVRPLAEFMDGRFEETSKRLLNIARSLVDLQRRSDALAQVGQESE